MRAPFMCLSALCAVPRVAFAHSGAHGPDDLMQAWTLEPVVLGLLAVLCISYAVGSRRTPGRRRPIAPWRMACYWGGIVALSIALVSPVDALGELLFSGHMIQHLTLTMVAAPLLVLGDGGLVMLRSLPLRARRGAGRLLRRQQLRRVWRWLTSPPVAWSLHAAALAVWHIPAPYELAIGNDFVHALEHATFFLTAVLFWWVVAAPRPRARMHFGAALLYLFTAATLSGVLGAALTLSTRVWYSVHERWVAGFGLTALDDQQLAGLIMWVPAGMLYLLALVPLVISALTRGRGQRTTHEVAAVG